MWVFCIRRLDFVALARVCASNECSYTKISARECVRARACDHMSTCIPVRACTGLRCV